MGEHDGMFARWRDLRRHPALQAAAVYVGGSWALIQVADIFFPSLDIVRALGIVLAVGFFVVVGVAWWLASRPAEPTQGEVGEAETAARSVVRRRRRRLAYAAAATLLMLGGVFWWLRPNILGAVNPDAQVIAVLPFNTSGPGVELLGEGVVDLLSPNLDAVANGVVPVAATRRRRRPRPRWLARRRARRGRGRGAVGQRGRRRLRGGLTRGTLLGARQPSGTGRGPRAARRHAELALRYAARLPDKERTLVAAHQLFEVGDLAAHDTMVRYVNRYGGDPEGWYMLGDVRFHARPLLDLDLEELFEPFDRVMELDPSLAPALIHPLELSLTFDDSARYVRYLTELRGLVEPPEVERFELAKAFWDRPDSLLAWFPNLMQTAANLGGAAIVGSYKSKNISPNDLLAVFELGLQQIARNAHTYAQGLQAGGLMLASVGRLRDARALFDTLWAVAPDDEAAFLSLLPVIAGIADSTFAETALSKLRNPPDRRGATRASSYALMLFALSQGRASEARRLGNRALASDTTFNSGVYVPLVRAGLGWADILDGDTVGGLAKLKSGLEEAGFARADALAYGQPLRLAWAVTQVSRSEARAEGIRRLRYGFYGFDFYYLAMRYLLLGQALEAAGDRAAAEAYSQFIRLWERADPELQPRVETARRALERLAAERSG